jgi:hypothetical protein
MRVRMFRKGWSYPKGVRKELEEKYPDIEFIGDSVATGFKEATENQISQFEKAVSEMTERFPDCFPEDQNRRFFQSLADHARAEGREFDAVSIENKYLK